jgi:hypothetical protein
MKIVAAFSLLVAFAGVPGVMPSAAAAQRPNIVWIKSPRNLPDPPLVEIRQQNLVRCLPDANNSL